MKAMTGMVWFRVLIGAVWLGAGLEKLLNPEFPRLFDAVLQTGGFVSQGPSWFQAFMHSYALPNAEAFAIFVGVVEVVLGVGLVLGALTNLSTIGGIFLSLMFLTSLGGVGIGTGLGSPGLLPLQMIMVLSSLIILLSPGAKAASVDNLLAARSPRLAPLLLSARRPVTSGDPNLEGMTGLTGLRLLLGAIWLNGGLEKLLNPEFPRLFDAVLQTGGYIDPGPPLFEAFMRQYVVPNAELFALASTIGELALGVGLIFGAFTNLAAIGSIFMNLMLLVSLGGLTIGTGLGAPGFLPLHMLLVLSSLIILLSPGAKAASVDNLLAARSPRLAPLLLSIRGH